MSAARRHHAAPLAALAVAIAALYARVVGFDFVQYDDHELLVQHYGELVKDPATVFWRDAFAVLGREARGVFYRPLLVASYAIEEQIAGPRPGLFHAVNVALHLFATWLAYALFVAFGAGRAGPAAIDRARARRRRRVVEPRPAAADERPGGSEPRLAAARGRARVRAAR